MSSGRLASAPPAVQACRRSRSSRMQMCRVLTCFCSAANRVRREKREGGKQETAAASSPASSPRSGFGGSFSSTLADLIYRRAALNTSPASGQSHRALRRVRSRRSPLSALPQLIRSSPEVRGDFVDCSRSRHCNPALVDALSTLGDRAHSLSISKRTDCSTRDRIAQTIEETTQGERE